MPIVNTIPLILIRPFARLNTKCLMVKFLPNIILLEVTLSREFNCESYTVCLLHSQCGMPHKILCGFQYVLKCQFLLFGNENCILWIVKLCHNFYAHKIFFTSAHTSNIPTFGFNLLYFVFPIWSPSLWWIVMRKNTTLCISVCHLVECDVPQHLP